MTRTRLQPDDRHRQILAAAVAVAGAGGYLNMTRKAVAEHANVSVGLVNRYFDTLAVLRDHVMTAAVEQNLPEIIAQGLASGSQIARSAPVEIRAAAVARLGGDL